MKTDRTFRALWLWSLGFFLLAVFTGLLYRTGLILPLPMDLSLTNIRHAHSHLMFFNWVAPIPMLFILRHISASAGVSAAAAFRRPILFIMAAGFLAYPFFLFYGYRPVPIGDSFLPLSVILSGGVMIGWYWFAAVYLKYREKSRKTLARSFYEAALLLLVISSLGAWGVAVVQFSEADFPLLSAAFTHFFLAIFTTGWCVLSALGIIYDVFGPRTFPSREAWLITPIVLGVPLTFPLGISSHLLTPQLRVVAAAGALLVFLGLAANLRWMICRKEAWTFQPSLAIIFFYTAAILLLAGGVGFPWIPWIGEHGLRILYLHLFLLGFVSLTYFTAWHKLHPGASRSGWILFITAVSVLLLSLLFASGLLPPALVPGNLLQILVVTALLPLLAGIWEWMVIFRHSPAPPDLPDSNDELERDEFAVEVE